MPGEYIKNMSGKSCHLSLFLSSILPSSLTTFFLSHAHFTHALIYTHTHTAEHTYVQKQSPSITSSCHAVTQDRQGLLSHFSRLEPDGDATSSSLHILITQLPGAAAQLRLRCHPAPQSHHDWPHNTNDPSHVHLYYRGSLFLIQFKELDIKRNTARVIYLYKKNFNWKIWLWLIRQPRMPITIMWSSGSFTVMTAVITLHS